MRLSPFVRLAAVLTQVLALATPPPAAWAQRAGPATAPAPVGPKSAIAPRAMVAAAHPLAVEAGVKVLRAGGGAVDAAVAIQAVLGLVEPQSSGLGGGGFLLYYDARDRSVTAYDGRETAPAGATPDMFLGPDGRPLSFAQAVTSGRATGAPGAVAMLSLAHKDHGRLAWRRLFGDATRLASEGFPVSRRLANYLTLNFPQSGQPDVLAYFTKPDGSRYRPGEVLRNPAYAATLGRLAAEGPDALLRGPIAAAMVARVAAQPLPGSLGLADLAAYRPNKSPALCRPYRVYTVCTPQLPSGGPALQELLGILAHTDIAQRTPKDPQGWFLFAEASRLMYADRDQHHGDPAFVSVPVQGLLDPAYTRARAALIGDAAIKPVTAGKPAGAVALAPDATAEPAGTSSFIVVDRRGNVAVMTTTVESLFGSGRMAGGFFLNNQLTDFSFAPVTPEGAPAANAVAPGKRPRSSMSPAVVLDAQGRFVAGVGSPGGSAILAYVGKTLVGVLDWELPLPDAIGLPNLIARGEAVGAESSLDPAVSAALQAKGLSITPGRGEESGLHGAARLPSGIQGAADPRREGIAAGF